MKALIQELYCLDINIVFVMISVNYTTYISVSHSIAYVHRSFFSSLFLLVLKSFPKFQGILFWNPWKTWKTQKILLWSSSLNPDITSRQGTWISLTISLAFCNFWSPFIGWYYWSIRKTSSPGIIEKHFLLS